MHLALGFEAVEHLLKERDLDRASWSHIMEHLALKDAEAFLQVPTLWGHRNKTNLPKQLRITSNSVNNIGKLAGSAYVL